MGGAGTAGSPNCGRHCPARERDLPGVVAVQSSDWIIHVTSDSDHTC